MIESTEVPIENIEYFDKSNNIMIQLYPKQNNINYINNININDIINETVISKFFYINLYKDSIESLLLNLVNDSNAYGMQIAKRIGRDIAKRNKPLTPKMKKYKSFQ